MIVQATKVKNEVRFIFYTYDPCGRDIKITIYAENINTARAQFSRVYGKDTPVDAVRTPCGDLV